MIPDQRHLFDLPDDIAYLNCAYTSPLLRSAAAAGQGAIRAKQNPWNILPSDFFSGIEAVRKLFAKLIEGDCGDVAIVPAVSYGIALAAKILPVAENQEIVVLQDQFPSNIYSWRDVASAKGAKIRTVGRPEDSDWTAALLSAITENTAIVAVSNCHWTDGTLIDLVAVGERCRTVGAALVVDGTQSLGALPLSVKAVQPDILVAASHKWLLGAYSFGYCYVARKHQGAKPLEENWLNRAGSEDFSRLVDYRDAYQPGARRFDMGEASNFLLAPIAAAALTQLLEWGVPAIGETLREKTDRIAEWAERKGLHVAPSGCRAPHMIGVSKPGGFGGELAGVLAEEKVYVSVRGDAVRVAPHLYTTDAELDRLFSALGKVM